jgi:hypothetical protein
VENNEAIGSIFLAQYLHIFPCRHVISASHSSKQVMGRLDPIRLSEMFYGESINEKEQMPHFSANDRECRDLGKVQLQVVFRYKRN